MSSMIEIPSLGGDISLLEGVTAVAIFVTGYVIHEVLHVIPLKLLGHEYTIEILPTKEGESKLYALFFGTVVGIAILDNPPRSHVACSALAPSIMAVFPVTGLFFVFLYPVVDIGTALVLLAWFSVSIPSARDWVTVMQYRQAETNQNEVVNHG